MEDMAALHISGRSHSQKLINNIIIDCVFVHYLEIRCLKILVVMKLFLTLIEIKHLPLQIGPFALEWLPTIQSPTLLVDFLQLIINVVKFNATYLDENIVHGIVQ